MNARPRNQGLWVAAGAAVLVGFLIVVRDVLPPFLIALAVAALLDPLLDRMQRRGWSRRAAVFLTFVLFLAVFLVIAMILLPMAITQASDLIRNVPAFYDQLTEWFRVFTAKHHALMVRLRLPTTTSAWLENYNQQIQGFLRTLLGRTVTLLAVSLSKVAWLAIIPIVTFYLMLDLDSIRLRALSLLPSPQRDEVLRMGGEIGAVFVGYLRGLCIVCMGYAALNVLLLSIVFRLPYGLVLGLLSGIFYAVPYVGFVATLALGTLIALTAHPTTGYVLGVAAALLAVNELFDQIITPRVVGGLVGLHPVVSLFALTTGGNLFGLMGMILAVPVAASIQVILVHLFPGLRKPLPPESPPQPEEKRLPEAEPAP